MAKKGRKRKPTAVKALTGNPGKRPLAGKEPQPPGEVKKPYGLKKYNPQVSKLWDRYAPGLMAVGLLTPVDVPAFLLMLQHLQFTREAAQEVRYSSLTRLDEAGVERKHPLLQVFRDNSAAFRQWCTEFGMTPSSRSGLAVPEPEMPTLAQELFLIAKGGG